MAKTINVYTLAELKESHPDAYAKVLARWADCCTEPNWADETMDSLKAVVKACGGTMKKWSIGAHSPSSMTVEADDEDEDGEWKDAEWLRLNVLAPNGYVKADGTADFPGHCKWTGYCADDDFIEDVYKSMKGGDTLTKALEGLATVASRLMERDLEDAQSEESMLANWDGCQFTEDGIED